MQLIDPSPVSPFDATAFATYTSEEFATPTESELVEELPVHLLPEGVELPQPPAEKPLRRGVGYLRAESAPKKEHPANDAPASEASDFGAGLDEADAAETLAPNIAEGGAVADVTGPASPSSGKKTGNTVSTNEKPKADSPQGDSRPGNSNRRRRNRSRRRAADDRETDRTVSDATQPTTPTEPDVNSIPAAGTSNAGGVSAEDSTEKTDGEKPVGGGRKRKRRRRRGKGRGGAAGGGATG